MPQSVPFADSVLRDPLARGRHRSVVDGFAARILLRGMLLDSHGGSFRYGRYEHRLDRHSRGFCRSGEIGACMESGQPDRWRGAIGMGSGGGAASCDLDWAEALKKEGPRLDGRFFDRVRFGNGTVDGNATCFNAPNWRIVARREVSRRCGNLGRFHAAKQNHLAKAFRVSVGCKSAQRCGTHPDRSVPAVWLRSTAS